VRTKGAAELEPGVYRVVLEPYAFADLLDYFSHAQRHVDHRSRWAPRVTPLGPLRFARVDNAEIVQAGHVDPVVDGLGLAGRD